MASRRPVRPGGVKKPGASPSTTHTSGRKPAKKIRSSAKKKTTRSARPNKSAWRIDPTNRVVVTGSRSLTLPSTRAIVLCLVILVAFIAIFPTLTSYVGQQRDLASLRSQVEDAQARNTALQAELDRWSDPAYIKAQARSRLAFVMPGETPYKVIDPGTSKKNEDEQSAAAHLTPHGGTWYGTVWDSIRIAGGQ